MTPIQSTIHPCVSTATPGETTIARSVSDFRRDFDALRKLIATSAARMDGLEKNMESYVDQLEAGAKELGLRPQALAATGVSHTTQPPTSAPRSRRAWSKP